MTSVKPFSGSVGNQDIHLAYTGSHYMLLTTKASISAGKIGYPSLNFLSLNLSINPTANKPG